MNVIPNIQTLFTIACLHSPHGIQRNTRGYNYLKTKYMRDLEKKGSTTYSWSRIVEHFYFDKSYVGIKAIFFQTFCMLCSQFFYRSQVPLYKFEKQSINVNVFQQFPILRMDNGKNNIDIPFLPELLICIHMYLY